MQDTGVTASSHAQHCGVCSNAACLAHKQQESSGRQALDNTLPCQSSDVRKISPTTNRFDLLMGLLGRIST